MMAAVTANPGLTMSQLVKLTGVPAWAAQKILPELAAQGVIHYRMEQPNKVRKRKWYPGEKKPIDSSANVTSFKESVEKSTYVSEQADSYNKKGRLF